MRLRTLLTHSLPRDTRRAPASDDDVARLVREVVADWRMPPGPADWMARTEGHASSASPAAALRPTRRTLVAGTAGALGLVAVLAVSAVWLNGVATTHRPGIAATGTRGASTASSPSSDSSASSASESPVARGSGSPRATAPTSKLALYGPPLPALRPIVMAGLSSRVVDLSTGDVVSLPPTPPSGYGSSHLVRLGDGSLLGAVVDVANKGGTSDGAGGGRGASSATLTVTRYAADGRQTDSARVDTRLSAPWTASDAMPYGAAGDATMSSDGSTVYLGWTAWSGTGWHRGIDVVAIASSIRDSQVVQRASLPDLPATSGGMTTWAWGPSVTVAPDGRHVAITAGYGTAGTSTFERFLAPLDGTRIGSLRPFASAASAGACSQTGPEGFAASDVYYLVCSDGSPVLRRIGMDGLPLGDTTLPAQAFFSSSVPIDASAGLAYIWDPIGLTLERLDVHTGAVSGPVGAPKPAADAGNPLADLAGALGRWIAPSAAAKMYLQPAAALSPDGSRLYALGAAGSPTEPGGSLGVYVFDLRAMRYVANWAPTADLVSVAVSADGRFVLAAGNSGVDSGGTADGSIEASITVYDASTGAVRAVAGKLGSDGLLTFPDGERP